jgi:uncharacterized FlgJ-related protein
MIKKTAAILLLLTSTMSMPIYAQNEENNFVEVEISSLDGLMELFKQHHYTRKDWQTGNREVPRITFEGVSENWKVSSSKIPVKQKKQVFFRLMAPLVLIANENILVEREIVKSATLSSPKLLAIATKYRVVKNSASSLTDKQRQQLLQQVDIMPPSLALAQAAEESGWATSRFTEEGNAFFGQWDFSGKGMTPKRQRKELGNYGLARFDNPLDSVEGYMLNINITGAYKKLRVLRAKLRQENKAITGLELAGTLDKYSERGQAYIDGLRSMIRYNKLEDVDDAYLSDKIMIKLLTPKQGI